MADELVAELVGDALLDLLDLLIAELDDVAGAKIDQMVVVLLRQRLVARPPVAELVPLDDAGILEELHGAVDGGDGDVRVDRRGAAVELLHVRDGRRDCSSTRAMTRRWSVIRMPFSAQTASRLRWLFVAQNGSPARGLAELPKHDKRAAGRRPSLAIIALPAPGFAKFRASR